MLVVGLVVLAWALVMTFVLAVCRASGRADADGERLHGTGLDVPSPPLPGDRAPQPGTVPAPRARPRAPRRARALTR